MNSSSNRLDFPRLDQEHSNWCWAAVSVSVDHFFDSSSPWKQCRMVSDQLELACCDEVGADCNRPFFLQKALRRVGRLSAKPPQAIALTFDEVQQEIDSGCPIGVRIQWSGGGAHFLTLSGYHITSDGAQMLIVEDPNYEAGRSRVLYDNFVNSYRGTGRWQATFFLTSAGQVTQGGARGV